MYEWFPNSLGTANLLNVLDGFIPLIDTYNRVPHPDPKGIDLLEQVKDLYHATESLDNLATGERRDHSARLKSLSPADGIHLQALCTSLLALTQECSEFLQSLHSGLEKLLHERDLSAAQFASADILLEDQTWYSEIHQALKTRTEVLQLLLTAIHVLQYKDDTDEYGTSSPEARGFATNLAYGIDLIAPRIQDAPTYSATELHKALAAANAVKLGIPAASVNKHFYVGRLLNAFYTGRDAQMAKIHSAFNDNTYRGQKRFVIFGLGGCGKTEVALKYAEDSRNDYWGIFFVDGSSKRNASNSYAEIAKIGGVRTTEKAAKHWLATRETSWLLILDNVDNDQVPLDDLLPSGARGCVLITSRNPEVMAYGTVGDLALKLLPMQKEEANELILKTANEPRPWEKVMESASQICLALGYLPLALVHAGKAILKREARWVDYLKIYEDRVRFIRRRRHERSRSRSSDRTIDDGDSMNVFATYEILYQSMISSQQQRFQDAVELLHVFSFFHFQNISLEILIGAAKNPLREARELKEQGKEDEEVQRRIMRLQNNTWSAWFRECIARILRNLDTPTPLPSLLRNTDLLSEDDFESAVNIRARNALSVLLSRSLIMRKDKDSDSYTMHPLVHKWVRDRPDMATSQQALWCQIARSTLSSAVLVPPLGDTDRERRSRQDLLPHIMHAREQSKHIEKILQGNRTSRKSIWPVLVGGFGRMQAYEAVRFSRVYSEGGIFDEAERLQIRARQFCVRMLGEQHPISIKLTLLLAGTLSDKTQATEARALVRDIYDVCMRYLNRHDPLTLMVTDRLGEALCFIGRYNDSLALHQRAVEGMTKVYGESHEVTLKAKRNIARLHYKFFDYEKAAGLYAKVWSAMKRSQSLGEDHFETLIVQEDLAINQMQLGDDQLRNSHELMTSVFERRKDILGRDHPYTLLAMGNLGRIKTAMGYYEDAGRMLGEAVGKAESIVGENHFAVVFGKTHYAHAIAGKGEYKEAEDILKSVLAKPRYHKVTDEDGEHPDRLCAMWYLIDCLEKQGKYKEELEVMEAMDACFRVIGGRGNGTRHTFYHMVQDRMQSLRTAVMENRAPEQRKWHSW